MKKTYTIMKNPQETKGHVITSSDNKKFKELKRLTLIEGIKKTERTIISGTKMVIELLERDDVKVESMIIFDGYSEENDFLNDKLQEHFESGTLFILKKSLYNELDPFNTGSPLISVKIPGLEEWDRKAVNGCTLLIPFQDPVNVGSVIRSAVGFNVNKIVLLKEAAHPFHPKSIRTSAGTVFSANIERGPSIDSLHDIAVDDQEKFITLDKGGKDISKFKFPGKFILLPGMEGPGLPDQLKINSVSIPLNENVESLNAMAALSIVLYEWKR